MKTFALSQSTGAGSPDVAGFFDPRTFSVQYIVSDPATKQCAIIDPVLDFDEKSGATATFCADALLTYVEEEGLTVAWILDTHPHADHFSAAQYLKEKTGAPTAIGQYVTQVQALWKEIYHWPEMPTDGRQWDTLFVEGDTFAIGELSARVLHSPGHTLASITYVIGDTAFVHDTLFQPDFGTARAIFPVGMPSLYGTPFSRFSRCRAIRGCSPATTICPMAVSQRGRAVSMSSEPTTRTWLAKARRSTSPYATSGIASYPCPS